MDGCEINFAPRNEATVETIVCWYLQVNRIIPGFLRRCLRGFCPSVGLVIKGPFGFKSTTKGTMALDR